MKSSFLSLWRCLAVLAITACLASCSGGGGVGAEEGIVADGTITSDNAGGLAGAASASEDLAIGLGGSQTGGVGVSSTAGPRSLMRLALDEARRKMASQIHTAGGHWEDGSPCDFGGRLEIELSWDGPASPGWECEVSNVVLVGTYERCSLDWAQMDGTIVLRERGGLCNPSGLYLGLDDFSYYDGVLDIAGDFTVDLTNLAWQDDSVYSGVILRADCTLSGEASGSFQYCQGSVRFHEFRLSYRDRGDSIRVTLDGYYRDDALDGWVRFETLETIVYLPGDDWPISGRLTVTGKGSADLVFSEGTLYVSCNGRQVAQYHSWVEVPGCF